MSQKISAPPLKTRMVSSVARNNHPDILPTWARSGPVPHPWLQPCAHTHINTHHAFSSHRSSRSSPRRTQYTSTQLARRTAGMGALSTCTPRRWSLKITPVHQLPNESSLCSHNQRGCGCMGPPCTDLGCTSPHTPIRTQPKVRPDTRRAGPRAIRPMHARARA